MPRLKKHAEPVARRVSNSTGASGSSPFILDIYIYIFNYHLYMYICYILCLLSKIIRAPGGHEILDMVRAAGLIEDQVPINPSLEAALQVLTKLDP